MKLDMETYTARCQLWLSMIFLTGYFIVILLFMLGFAKIPTDYKESFSGLLTLLTGGGLTILYFWFQRTRSAGTPPGPGAEEPNRDNRNRSPSDNGDHPSGDLGGSTPPGTSTLPTGVRRVPPERTATDNHVTS